MEHPNSKPLAIKKHTGAISGSITPPASKSESNRVLIIDALTGHRGDIQNLSNARDTQTMIRLLKSDDHVLDVTSSSSRIFLAATRR